MPPCRSTSSWRLDPRRPRRPLAPNETIYRERCLSAESEDDDVGRRVVGERLLRRHGADHHLDLRRRRERRLLGDAEGDRLRGAHVDQADRPALHDRGRLLHDRQRDGHLHLLRLAGVLDRDLEGEVRRGRDRRLARRRELLAAREHLGRDEPDAVDARRIRGRRGGAVDALPDRDHRAGAREVRVRQHLRVGHRDARDVLVLQLTQRRVAEVEAPVHVARRQELHLLREQRTRLGRVLRLRGLAERVREARDPARPQLQRLDEMLVLDAQRPRRVDLLGLVGVLRLLLREPVQLGLEVRLLDPGRRERVVQLPADAGRSGRDRPDGVHVGRVRVVLARAAAALDHEDEDHDEEDREGDETDEAEQARRLGRGPDLTPRSSRPSGSAWAPAVSRSTPTLRGLLSLRLVEEVELDVGVALGHGALAPQAPVNSTESPGQKRNWTYSGRTVREMLETAPAVARNELVLDRYRPLRPLGTGGSGSVWLARDERTGLEVALKVVTRDGKAGHRAEREAHVAARLRHERCLRAYACGSDSRHVYIAYEYAPGRTLRDALRAGELRDTEAVEAAAQVLEGLAHAHARGVVHRDVKPANVLLADGDGISVRLLDFGLAQT
ncbi:MAG: serine/threonine protein kinase, partial [Actinobacteria bacterium]